MSGKERRHVHVRANELQQLVTVLACLRAHGGIVHVIYDARYRLPVVFLAHRCPPVLIGFIEGGFCVHNLIPLGRVLTTATDNHDCSPRCTTNQAIFHMRRLSMVWRRTEKRPLRPAARGGVILRRQRVQTMLVLTVDWDDNRL